MSWNRHIFTADDAPTLTALLNAEFDAAKANSGTGTGGVIAGLTGSGRLATTEAQAANSGQFLPPTPALAFTLPLGFLWIQDGVAFVADEATVLTGLPASFEGFVTLHAQRNDEGDFIEWTFTTASTRGTLGTGTLSYIETDSDSVTLLDASEVKSDVIFSLPLLLARINAGGTTEGGAVYWDLIKRSAVDPTTIAQFVTQQIDAQIGAGQGATIIPPEVRDEVMVNVLHSLALHQISVNDAFERVSPFHAIVVSPGRGTGDWAYDELTDAVLTTMPVDTVAHEFGSTP